MNPTKILGLSLVAGMLTFSAPAFASNVFESHVKGFAKSMNEMLLKSENRDLKPDALKKKSNELLTKELDKVKAEGCTNKADVEGLKALFKTMIDDHFEFEYKLDGGLTCSKTATNANKTPKIEGNITFASIQPKKKK